MSVRVDLAELAAHLRHYGFAYLMTVGDDLRPHAVAVHPTLDGRTLEVAGLGRRTRTNLAARPEVSLVWPPFEQGGYSLIVDGTARVDTDADADGDDAAAGDGDTGAAGARITLGHAVLHRPADHGRAAPAGHAAPGGATGCGNDCVPLES